MRSHGGLPPLASLLLLTCWAATGCKPATHYLGFDVPDDYEQVGSGGGAGSGPAPCQRDCDAGGDDDSPPSPQEASAPPSGDDDMMSHGGDSGVPNTPDGRAPHPLKQPPQNYFETDLGKAPEVIDARLEGLYDQFFHGNPSTEAVYVAVGDDEAYIYDVRNRDTRADALGYGLLLSVELDHRTEFDNIWRFTDRRLRITTGPALGLLYERCPPTSGDCAPPVASYGAFFVVTALLLAEARWGSDSEGPDYGAAAASLMESMQNTMLDGEHTAVFIPDANVPRYRAGEEATPLTQPVLAMAAFFEYWGAQSGSAFWLDVADASRRLQKDVADPSTGLIPSRYDVDAQMVPANGDVFDAAAYGYPLGLALDHSWYGVNSDEVDIADRLVRFFSRQRETYGSYRLDGTVEQRALTAALPFAIASAAGIATDTARIAMIQHVWDADLARGDVRFFDGMMHMLSFLFLAGKWRAY